MKKFLLGVVILLGVLVVVYLLGPQPDAPQTTFEPPALPTLLRVLEAQIQSEESTTPGLKPGCEARIVWADSLKKQATPYALLYLHGFSASPGGEGDPVAFNLAKTFGCNLFLARMAGHGVDLGDETMANLTTDEYLTSAEKGLAIAKQLGDTVLVMGTSAGGALSLWLASRHPEIKAVVAYSPCIKIYDQTATLLDNPWGLQIAKMVVGKPFNDVENPTDGQKRFWTTHYRLEGLVALQNFLTHDMTPETFGKVKCPTLVAYYFKNEEEQDKVVSVPAILTMFGQLGTRTPLKRVVNLPSTARHEMASKYLSKDWQSVERETVKFLQDVVGLKPVNQPALQPTTN
ncbi:MAG: alpha/beta hydrolase [Cytophagaceae bacterium]|nr:alpha/beta hydrolase [Cytophagaceae bacterium]